jgi:hypothetical protein
MADTSSGGAGTTFHRYRDAQGREVIVDSLSKVPSSARRGTESITLAPPVQGPSQLSPESLVRELHWPSFAVGAACALALAGVLFGRRLALGFAARTGLVIGLLALAAGAYFGWAHRMVNPGGALLASPDALIQDARDAVQKMNARGREQQRTLDELEAQR